MEQDKPLTRKFYILQHAATGHFRIRDDDPARDNPSWDANWTKEVLDAVRFPTGEKAEAYRLELCRHNEEFRRTNDALQVVHIEVTVRYLQFSWKRL